MPRLLSVNVGLPRDIAWRGETVRTAIWKEPVQGRRMVRRLNIDGDGQADLAGHGGEYRTVFVYQMESYHYWERQLGRNDFVFGQFGENFTVDGLSDEEVCVGDQYRVPVGTIWIELPTASSALHQQPQQGQSSQTEEEPASNELVRTGQEENTRCQ